MTSFYYSKQLLGGLEDYNEWHRNNEFLGFLYYILSYFILIPLTFPQIYLFILGGFLYGGIYGKVKGFFLCFAILFIVYPIAAAFSFLIGKRYLKKYI